MGTPEEFRSMLREFLIGSDRLLADLQQARRAGRDADVQHTAHTLKSMAHMVGARRLEQTCRHLEAAARVHHVPQGAVADLSTCVRQAQGAVERILP
jgi:HPt (histidine-containing phosphotransfer) domain-containing protein